MLPLLQIHVRSSVMFYRSSATLASIYGATGVQQRPKRSIFSHCGHHIVEVTTVHDIKALVIVRWSEHVKLKRTQQYHNQSNCPRRLHRSLSLPPSRRPRHLPLTTKIFYECSHNARIRSRDLL
ncbi:hypothetical protein BDR03DRAFT_954143 [Suillus americanus]|nr:hypothetical protein BDR03DRAFT_954143 [Suillus americanus]